MSSPTPLLGRSAVVKIGTTAVGYCRNVTVSIDADLIKEYALGGDKPVFISSGNKSFKVNIGKMYVDSTHASNVLSGTAITIDVFPQGEGTGKPKITISNVILNSWEMSIDQKGVILESVKGEGTDITFGTSS